LGDRPDRVFFLASHDDRDEAGVRGHAAETAFVGKALSEGDGVSGEDGFQDRMFGLRRLQHRAPRLVGTARAARDLIEHLIRALGRAQVAAHEAKISIDHAHQSQVRKIMALRDDLRADDDVGFAVRDVDDLLLEGFRIGCKVRG